MAIVQLMQSNLAANSVNDLLLNADTGASNIRFIKFPSKCILAIEASAVGIEYRVISGGRTVVERSTLDASGTTGTMPSLDQKAVTFDVAGGDILQIELREIAGVATVDVMATLSVNPG